MHTIETMSQEKKVATHITFDEAGFTILKHNLTPTQWALQDAGYINLSMDAPTDDPTNDPYADPIAIPITKHKDPTGIPTANPPMEETLLVQLLSNHARLPIRSTPELAGLHLFSAATVTITPNTQQLIPTDISICPPPGTYCQILPRSGLVLKHCVTTRAGTIDRDYCGNVQVILHNSGQDPFTVAKGDRIAQLVTYYVATPTPVAVNSLSQTTRSNNGFGSISVHTAAPYTTPYKDSNTPADTIPADAPTNAPIKTPAITQTPDSTDDINTGQDTTSNRVCYLHSAPTAILQHDGRIPYNIWLSQDPFQSRISIQLDVKGDHDTLGLKCTATPHGKLQLLDMAPDTPAIKLPRWRSTLKRALLLTVDNKPVSSLAELQVTITEARSKQLLKINLVFATISSPAIHPTEGSLHLYYDQLNVIGKHLKTLKTETAASAMTHSDQDAHIRLAHQSHLNEAPISLDPDLGKFLTWKEIEKHPDLPQWKTSRYKMLDDYMNQGMFSKPMPKPDKANIHHMLWRYFMKLDGT
jgi:dUTP pyrophosphatase